MPWAPPGPRGPRRASGRQDSSFSLRLLLNQVDDVHSCNVCFLTSRGTRDDGTSGETGVFPCHLLGRKNRKMLDLFTANPVYRSSKNPAGKPDNNARSISYLACGPIPFSTSSSRLPRTRA